MIKTQLGSGTFTFEYPSGVQPSIALQDMMEEALRKDELGDPVYGWTLVDKMLNKTLSVAVSRSSNAASPIVFDVLYVVKSSCVVGPDKFAIFACFGQNIVVLSLSGWDFIDKTAAGLRGIPDIRYRPIKLVGDGYYENHYPVWRITWYLECSPRRSKYFLFVNPKWLAVSVTSYEDYGICKNEVISDNLIPAVEAVRIPIGGVLGVFELRKKFHDGLSSHIYLNTAVMTMCGHQGDVGGYPTSTRKAYCNSALTLECTIRTGSYSGSDTDVSIMPVGTSLNLRHEFGSSIRLNIGRDSNEVVDPFTGKYTPKNLIVRDNVNAGARFRGEVYGLKMYANVIAGGRIGDKVELTTKEGIKNYSLIPSGLLDHYANVKKYSNLEFCLKTALILEE